LSTVSKFLFVIVFLVVGSVGAMTARQVFVVDESTDIPVPEINGFVLQQPRVLPEFALLDGQARAFARSDFESAWSLLYFGFTYCPDICPTAMVEMAKLKDLLAASRPDVAAEYYLVSVDPQRDTPERIQEYVTFFDDSFKGLTGDLLEIGKLAQTASVIHVIEPSADGASYEVGHSSTLTLVDPQGNIRAIFKEPLRASALANDIDRVLTYVKRVSNEV